MLASVAPAAGPIELDLYKVRAGSARYKGKNAIHLVSDPPRDNDDGVAVIKGSKFRDGVIEVDLVGNLASGHSENARGFIGIAFRVQPDQRHYEMLTLRPTNARSDDQYRRNHTAAYEGHPDFPFDRLRAEREGVYESYVDIALEQWTHLKVVVSGSKAQMYVNRASQPALIINDLKEKLTEGAIALWCGPGTDGFYANLKITPSN